MNTGNNTIPQDLIQAIRDNRLVLFVGAGFSKNINKRLTLENQLPDWNEFTIKVFEKLAKRENNTDKQKHYEDTLQELVEIKKNENDKKEVREIEKTNTKKDYRRILSEVRKEDRHIIYEFIYENFRLPAGSCSEIHELALKLTNMIITTNYDNALETTYEKMFGGSRPMTIIGPLARNRTLLFKLRDNLNNNEHGEFIFKIHGCASAPDSCVIFTEQYEKLYYSIPKGEDYDFYLTRKSLEKILEEMTVLFIGVSFEDEYMRNLFGYICGDDRYHNKHYVITDKKDEKKFKDIQYLSCLNVDSYDAPLVKKIQELVHYKNIYNQSVDRLGILPIFSGLSSKALGVFRKNEKTYNENAYLAKKGDEANSFYVILKGIVVAKDEDRDTIIRNKDDIIGEFGFAVNGNRIRNIICQENDTHVIEINKETMRKISQEDQNILWRNIVEMLLNKERESNKIEVTSDEQKKDFLDWEGVAKSLSDKLRKTV